MKCVRISALIIDPVRIQIVRHMSGPGQSPGGFGGGHLAW